MTKGSDEPVEFDDAEAGTPLSKDELRQARENLAEWHSPSDFRNAVFPLCDRCTSPDYFNRPQLKFLHDAFVIAEFVGRHPVDGVKLAAASEQWPDGYVRLDGEQHNVEVTGEHDDRRLGDEYKHVTKPTLGNVDDWANRAERIPNLLDKTIRAKISKHYSSPVWLIVHLNVDEFGIRQVRTENEIARIKEKYAGKFEAIFVLWKDKLL